MKHAREDYNRIQDPANLIPEHEPVFLLRGKDVAAPAAIEAWCKEAKKYGADDNIIQAAQEHADKMRVWQIEHESKVPDMP
jgi:hypothetical protein